MILNGRLKEKYRKYRKKYFIRLFDKNIFNVKFKWILYNFFGVIVVPSALHKQLKSVKIHIFLVKKKIFYSNNLKQILLG